jgi:hypothetical protein
MVLLERKLNLILPRRRRKSGWNSLWPQLGIFYHSATKREIGKEEHAFFFGFLEFTPLLSRREER